MTNLRLLLWVFYKPLFIINLVATSYTIKVIVADRLLSIPFLVLIKLLGYLCGTGYQYVAASHHYYFYRNAGYRIRKLYAYTYLLDFAAFTLIITATISVLNAIIKN
ncbi:hypothetical protein [Mucilaginibacter sp.]